MIDSDGQLHVSVYVDPSRGVGYCDQIEAELAGVDVRRLGKFNVAGPLHQIAWLCFDKHEGLVLISNDDDLVSGLVSGTLLKARQIPIVQASVGRFLKSLLA